MADPVLLGKPVGQDVALGRPSAAIDLGLGGAIAYFEKLVQSAVDSVPECASRELMRQLVRQESERLVPREACDKFRNVDVVEVKKAVAQSNQGQSASKSVAV